MKELKRVYFREILPGDIRKFKEVSNDAATGGGARDLRIRLRIRPDEVFRRIIAPMFPYPGEQEGNSRGTISWVNEEGKTESLTLDLWRPTDARPGELRIPKISRIRKWQIDEGAYLGARQAGLHWFYVLAQDEDAVWAVILKEEDLDKQDKIIADFVRKCIRSTKGNRAVSGGFEKTTEGYYFSDEQ